MWTTQDRFKHWIAARAGEPPWLQRRIDSTIRRSDLYAAGVTLYHLLTRKYPYGEVEPFQHPRFGDPVPPTRFRPDIPKWLENLLLKSVASDPKLRFETAEELLLALERGERSALMAPPRTPLIAYAQRAPWQSIATVSVVINLLLLYLLLAR